MEFIVHQSPAFFPLEHANRLRTVGYTTVSGAIDHETLSQLNEEIDDLLRVTCDGLSIPSFIHSWRLPSGVPYLFKIKPIQDILPSIFGINKNSYLIAIISAYWRGRGNLFEAKIMMKEQVPLLPMGDKTNTMQGDVLTHRDSTYFVRKGRSPDCISSGFLLNDCTMENGPLMVWPGSHLEEMREHDDPLHGPLVSSMDAPERSAVPLIGKAGDLLIWHSNLVHASKTNNSGNPRRFVVFGHEPAF